jgi:hypothetical protein
MEHPMLFWVCSFIGTDHFNLVPICSKQSYLSCSSTTLWTQLLDSSATNHFKNNSVLSKRL